MGDTFCAFTPTTLEHAVERDMSVNGRVRFIAAYLEADRSFVELCEDFGISRKQGYK